MTKATQVLRDLFDCEEMSDDDLQDVVQDIVTAESSVQPGIPHKLGNKHSLDTLAALCEHEGVVIGDGDGLLLIQVDTRGVVTSHVLRLGIMTEGRIEGALMPIFNTVVRARARYASEVNRGIVEDNDA